MSNEIEAALAWYKDPSDSRRVMRSYTAVHWAIESFSAGAEWQRSQSAPAGYVMVPVELLEQAQDLLLRASRHRPSAPESSKASEQLRALLAAAPKAEPVQEPARNPDVLALNAAREIMALVYGPTPTGGSPQLLAQIQCVVSEAIVYAEPQSPVQEPVAYLDIGIGGYVDIGSDKPIEELEKLPMGRHMLAIIGTYGIDGYTAAPQPSDDAKDALRKAIELVKRLTDYHPARSKDIGYALNWLKAMGSKGE